MNAWSSVSTVLGVHIYLLHCVGICPFESIKEENHASPGNSDSAGSQTCSATRLAMAITDLPQVRSAHLTELPAPRVLLRTDLQMFSVSLSCLRSWQPLKQRCDDLSLCDLLGILFPSSSSPWLCLKPKAKLSMIPPKHLLCCRLTFSESTASAWPAERE